jgi:hypothetical protein
MQREQSVGQRWRYLRGEKRHWAGRGQDGIDRSCHGLQGGGRVSRLQSRPGEHGIHSTEADSLSEFGA